MKGDRIDGEGVAAPAERRSTGRTLGPMFPAGRRVIGCFLLVAAAAGLVRAACHPTRPWTDTLSIAAILLFSFLVLFRSIARTARDVTTAAMVRAIDCPCLLAAEAGLAMSRLRQDDARAVHAISRVISWSRPVVRPLIAALALRLTRTTIEVFGWHYR